MEYRPSDGRGGHRPVERAVSVDEVVNGREGEERTLTRLVVMCSRRSCMSLSRKTRL